MSDEALLDGFEVAHDGGLAEQFPQLGEGLRVLGSREGGFESSSRRPILVGKPVSQSDRGMEPIYQLTRAIVIPWCHVWFKWHIEGIENIPKTGPAILAFNHIAYLDPLIIGYIVDRAGRKPRFLSKSELFEDKRIAWILRGCGQIEVKRGTRDAPIALNAALDALERGEVVVIFPEGTVTTDPDLNPIPAKTGAPRLALRSGVPVIPGAVWGTANVWPKGYAKRWRPRQPIVARIGKPILLDGSPESPADWQAAGAAIMDEIGVLAAGLRPLVPDLRRPARRRAGKR